MITPEQADIIRTVMNRFNKNETLEWTKLDESMVHLSWLTDAEVVIESEIQLNVHSETNARCRADHPKEQCFVPVILQAIEFVTEDFKTSASQRLARKSRYVLEYYLAASQVGVIIND